MQEVNTGQVTSSLIAEERLQLGEGYDIPQPGAGWEPEQEVSSSSSSGEED